VVACPRGLCFPTFLEGCVWIESCADNIPFFSFYAVCPCLSASFGAFQRAYGTGSSSSGEGIIERRGKKPVEPHAPSGVTATTATTPTTTSTRTTAGSYMPRTLRPTDHRASRSHLLRLHALYTPANISALSALGARIPHANLSEHVELVERCLIHPSFWRAVGQQGPGDVPSTADEAPSAATVAASEAKQLHTNFWDEQRAHNGPLETLGNSLLGLLAAEWIEGTYPYLPTRSVEKRIFF
jgi:hypothetical protein